MYKEIDDVRELERHSDNLTKLLRRQLTRRVRHSVGFPGGREELDVNFERGAEDGLLWWSSERSGSREAIINLIGRGHPDQSGYLLIDLQFNVPIKKFGRSHGGAFVEHVESGAILLAHRGIVTRGKSRVPKDQLFQEANAHTTRVVTKAGEIDLFLVASLDSENLLEDIATFSQEMRRAAAAVMDGGVQSTRGKVASGAEIDSKLKDYFDEFSGKRRIPGRRAAIVAVRHGHVVSELKKVLLGTGRLLKSREVDFAIRKPKEVWIFEVKTSVRPTDLYTAIGQLSLHALAAGDQFPGSRVRKILVVPSLPKPSVRRRFEDNLGIEIVTYSWVGVSRVKFEQDAFDAFA